MDSVDGGESGRVVDESGADNPVSNCKSTITAETTTEQENVALKFKALKCRRAKGGRCYRGKEQQIGTGWGY